MAGISKHHKAWLSDHKTRSPEWLRKIIAEGFEVHHIDHDHSNNHPKNLVLIEIEDHRALHGFFKIKDYSQEKRITFRKNGDLRTRPFLDKMRQIRFVRKTLKKMDKSDPDYKKTWSKLANLGRTKKLTANQRRLIAQRAAQIRWGKYAASE